MCSKPESDEMWIALLVAVWQKGAVSISNVLENGGGVSATIEWLNHCGSLNDISTLKYPQVQGVKK